MRAEGVEPAWAVARRLLMLVRMPVSPPPLVPDGSADSSGPCCSCSRRTSASRSHALCDSNSRGLSYAAGGDRDRELSSLSDAHDPVELLDHAGKLGGCRPARLHPLEGFVGRPTGDCASLSDVDGNVVVEELPEEIARRGDPDALDAFGRLL